MSIVLRPEANGLSQSPDYAPRHSAALMALEDVWKMAGHVAKAGMFGVNTPEQAFCLLMLAQAEGLHPMTALRRYHIVKNRPTMRADAMQAEFQSKGGQIRILERSKVAARATFAHPVNQPEPVEFAFTMRDAQDAGLTGPATMFAKYPEAMLWARLVTAAVRVVCPGIVAGIYSTEEVESFQDSDRRGAYTVDVPFEADAPTPEHHAANFDNGTGHGRTGAYAPPDAVGEYRAWRDNFVDQWNGKWLDNWTGPGGLDERVKELFPPATAAFQVSGHLVKWGVVNGLLSAPEDPKQRQKDPFAAVLWQKHRKELKAEADRYARQCWAAAYARLEPAETESQEPAEVKPEDESQDASADDVLDEAYPPEPGSDG